MTKPPGRPDRRDPVQIFVDGQLQQATGSPDAIAQAVTKATRQWLWQQPRQTHQQYDDILVSAFVKQRRNGLRHAGRPTRGDIIKSEIQHGGQMPLPQMAALVAWRWTDRSGKIEKAVWHSTLEELAWLNHDYEERMIDMAAKRRYLDAIIDYWRAHRQADLPKETVAQLYKRMGLAA